MQKTEKNTSLREDFFPFMKASLKGISQVILIDHAITGFIILLAIMVSSFQLGVLTLAFAMTGTLVAKLFGADEKSVNQGLFGYNSVLTGIALYLFLTGPFHWVIALIGAAIAVILTAATIHFMRNTGIPVLTFPFIILTWFILLVSYRLNFFSLTDSLVPQDLTHWKLNITGDVNWLEAIFNGIGQVFFLENTLSGILLFIAVFWAGWRFGLYAILGNVVALLTAYGLGGEHALIFEGLYGYNAILSCIAVALVFNDRNNRFSAISGVITACLTVIISASLSTWLLPYGLPALTMPFVLSTWLILGARKILPRL